MAEHHDFLNPLCLSTTLDNCLLRRAILDALCSQLGQFRGTVIDIGCGDMPYRSLLLARPSQANKYIGLDLKHDTYVKPDLEWDGRSLPFQDGSIDCALATEVLEHCPRPERVTDEAWRVLKPGGFLFFTVPFLWPLHSVPHDQYRYTPFALERILRSSGFEHITLRSLGGWDASLGQMIGLWVRHRPMSARTRATLSRLALPLVQHLARLDRPCAFGEMTMITGSSGTAVKPAG